MPKEQPPQSENPSWTPENIQRGEELAERAKELQKQGKPEEVIKALQEIERLFSSEKERSEAEISWEKFYHDEFGIDVDLSNLRIPERREGLDRLIVVAQGLTIEQVFQRCQERFKCWKNTDKDLDVAVPKNDRTPQSGPYAIWVRDVVEADEEHKNRSANDLEKAKIPGITLLERLLFELKYFLETGEHLDIQNWTLCSGSRGDDGDVPNVDWDDGQMGVGWYSPGFAVGGLRAREVVS